MSTTIDTAPPGPGSRRGLPRWAWLLIALLTLVAVVAVAVAVFASRGRDVIVLPTAPGTTPTPAASAPASSPSPSPSSGVAAPVDGCLGGATELDRAVLTAQRDAPLTPAGAAAFTATLVRWGTATPSPPFQDVTARQVLDPDATERARRFASSAESDLEGVVATIDFADGRYYVEAFDDSRTAIVSYVGRGTASKDGVPQGTGWLSGAAHLASQNGVWRFQDLSEERTIPDLQRIGTPYTGGC